MPPSSQKQAVRPISFVLHDTAQNAAPIVLPLVIRPEDLTVIEPSRLSVQQSLGGAWADNFGPGVPSINLNGTTGWGSGLRPSGLDEFVKLRDTVFARWHRLRAEASEAGLDPDKVRLILDDTLDGFTWVVAPQQFVLRRSKSRPLLAMYQITLQYVSDRLDEATQSVIDNSRGIAGFGVDSMEASRSMIGQFLAQLGAIRALIGAIAADLKSLVEVTDAILQAVLAEVRAVGSFVDAVAGDLLDVARLLTKAASNVFATVLAVQSLPATVQSAFVRVRSAFLNVYCVLTNVFRARQPVINYDDLYGASLCSSTSGGRPLSRYVSSNTLDSIDWSGQAKIAMTQRGYDAGRALATMDVVLNTPAVDAVGLLASEMAGGVTVLS